ncbi:MAG TPA: adenylate/guanylate cyclase domain-containing protein, partial [Chloroflexota bacterium]
MAACPRCAFSNPAGAKFCLNCGAPLAESRPVEGERRFVTVLFADVVGSTGMGEKLDPEQIAEIMNGAFSLFNAAVSRYGGIVSRLMGDAVLAIFGAPIAHEDDGERAVHAGLEIRDSARQYAAGVARAYHVDFRVRVGIHSGLAVLAMVGDQVKTEYTAMGDTANVAARLQSVADPGTVLISADTRHLLGNAFDLNPRVLLEVKGREAPIETYEVTAARATRDKQRGLDGLVSPLVGRDLELEL